MRRKQLPINIGHDTQAQHQAQMNEPLLETDTLQSIRHQLTHFATSSDVEHREMKSEDKQVNLLFVKSICDTQTITLRIVQPFWELSSLAIYQHYIRTLPGATELTDLSQVKHLLTHGKVAVFFADRAYLIEMNTAESEETPDSQTVVESHVEGPHHAFSENIKNNLNLFRNRYQSAHLHIDTQMIGELSPTQVALVYDQSRVNQTALDELKKDLEQIQVDLLVNGGHLHRILANKKQSLFPLLVSTECPDRTLLNLSQGKVIILVDHTPSVLIAPSIFSDFFVSMVDLYQLPVIGHLLIILRYVGLFIGVTLPALYVGIASFHPELFRAPLVLSIMGSHSALFEAVLLLVMMEVLSRYLTPIATMNFAMRVVRYVLLVLATFYGLVGVGIGIVAVIFHLASRASYGTPYLKMFRKAGPS